MKKFPLSLAMMSTMLVPILSAAPVQAQATRTWVSGAAGSDANPCSRAAPCQTFAGAISKTFINGEINCLDPAGFGSVTIVKSITIDCHEIFASILASGTNGVNINIAAGNPDDPLRTVRLRNLNINGTGSPNGTTGTRTGLVGINIISAAAVFLDDMLVTGFTQQGVKDARNGTGKLYIRNSVIRDNTGAGVAVAGTASPPVIAVIENSHLTGNGTGAAVGTNNQLMIARSVLSGNGTAGASTDPNGVLSINDSTISANGTGVASSSGAVIRLSNNDIAFNFTGISGATTSFGNNRIYPSVGTAPTPAGGDTHDKGQQ